MTQSPVEQMRDGFARLAEEGFEAMAELVHPEFEMETPAALAAEPQRYEGVDGFRRWWTSFYEVMDDVRLEPRAFHDLGPDRVAIEMDLIARGHSSGIETSQNVVLVTTLRGELISGVEFFADLDAARQSAT